MNCPSCDSNHIRKNGRKRGKQNYICAGCGRQFLDKYKHSRTYSNEMKEECLKMYLNGMGLRGIERVKGVHHTTIITWIKQLGQTMIDASSTDANERELSGEHNIPSVGELDELETPTHPECIQVVWRRPPDEGGMRGAFRTFVGSKK